MPIYATKIIRKDRHNPNPPNYVRLLDRVKSNLDQLDRLDYFNGTESFLSKYLNNQLPPEKTQLVEKNLNRIFFNDLSTTFTAERKRQFKTAIQNWVAYQDFQSFARKDPYELVKKNACLIGQAIESTHRELYNFDQYLSTIDDKECGWSISEHMYDRLIGPQLFKLSHIRFFTATYLDGKEKQAVTGFAAGPLSTTLISGLLAATLYGVVSPYFFIAFCCAPSIIYLIKGLECIKNAAELALCSNTETNTDHSLQIKINLQKAVSCFFIATLMPLAWTLTFPLELVRFVTRSISTIIELVKSCVDDYHADHVLDGNALDFQV